MLPALGEILEKIEAFFKKNDISSGITESVLFGLMQVVF